MARYPATASMPTGIRAVKFGVNTLLNCLMSVRNKTTNLNLTNMIKEFFDWDVIKAGIDSWLADCKESGKAYDETSYCVPSVTGAFLIAYWEGPDNGFPAHSWLQILDLDGCDVFENGLDIDTPEGWSEATASIDRWWDTAQKDWE